MKRELIWASFTSLIRKDLSAYILVLQSVFSDNTRLSMNVGKIEPLQNTQYVAECCRDIERDQEYPSDVYLVFLIQLQRNFPLRSGIDFWASLNSGSLWTLTASLQKELEIFQNSLSTELAQNSTLAPSAFPFLVCLPHNAYLLNRSSCANSSLVSINTQPRNGPL